MDIVYPTGIGDQLVMEIDDAEGIRVIAGYSVSGIEQLTDLFGNGLLSAVLTDEGSEAGYCLVMRIEDMVSGDGDEHGMVNVGAGIKQLVGVADDTYHLEGLVALHDQESARIAMRTE